MSAEEIANEVEKVDLIVCRLSREANKLVDRSIATIDIPAHPSFYALNRASHALEEAAKSLREGGAS